MPIFLLSRSGTFSQICLCSSHPCLLITVFSFCLAASPLCLSFRSGNVNPLQGSAFWGLAKWHPCYPECTGAGQRDIYLQCEQLAGPWQVGMLILEMNTDVLVWIAYHLEHNIHYNQFYSPRHMVREKNCNSPSNTGEGLTLFYMLSCYNCRHFIEILHKEQQKVVNHFNVEGKLQFLTFIKNKI